MLMMFEYLSTVKSPIFITETICRYDPGAFECRRLDWKDCMIILEAANLFALNYAYTIPQEIWLSEDNIGIKNIKYIVY